MGRVSQQKSARQAASNGALRGTKAGKQKKKHKVVLESVSQDQGQLRSVLSFRADPPPGYTFIPAGNPQLTAALKDFARKGSHRVYAVTTTPHAARHELSREVHRIGYHFPTAVVSQVCNHYGIRINNSGRLVDENENDKLFMKVYQKGQLVLDEKVRDQVTINTEAKEIIKDLFPNIPDNDLFQIIKTAFQLGDGKVGTADEIPLARRAQLSVVAHIRHTYTNYDRLLRQVPYNDARHIVEKATLQKLVEWRGDGDDKNDANQKAVDDIVREVVVISDEEESDSEVEEGQVLDNDDLRVQPVESQPKADHDIQARPLSPAHLPSEDEGPTGYRFVPHVTRRVLAQSSGSTSRQQSRYAVWEQVQQERRSGMVYQEPQRVITRTPLDQYNNYPPGGPTHAQPARAMHESVHLVEQASRLVPVQTTRMIREPTPPGCFRGADGALYQHLASPPRNTVTTRPPRRPYTPPTLEYLPPQQQLNRIRSKSPIQYRPLPRRTPSLNNNGETVLPSVEGPDGNYVPPTSHRNPFDMSGLQSVRYHESDPSLRKPQGRQAPIIDLTSSAERASKSQRGGSSPPSPYLQRRPDGREHEHPRIGTNVQALSPVASSDARDHHVIDLDSPWVPPLSTRTYRPSQDINGHGYRVRPETFVPGVSLYPSHPPARQFLDENDRASRVNGHIDHSHMQPIRAERPMRVVHDPLELRQVVMGPNSFRDTGMDAYRYPQSNRTYLTEAPPAYRIVAREQIPASASQIYVSSAANAGQYLAHAAPAMDFASSRPAMLPPTTYRYEPATPSRTTYVQN